MCIRLDRIQKSTKFHHGLFEWARRCFGPESMVIAGRGTRRHCGPLLSGLRRRSTCRPVSWLMVWRTTLRVSCSVLGRGKDRERWVSGSVFLSAGCISVSTPAREWTRVFDLRGRQRWRWRVPESREASFSSPHLPNPLLPLPPLFLPLPSLSSPSLHFLLSYDDDDDDDGSRARRARGRGLTLAAGVGRGSRRRGGAGEEGRGASRAGRVQGGLRRSGTRRRRPDRDGGGVTGPPPRAGEAEDGVGGRRSAPGAPPSEPLGAGRRPGPEEVSGPGEGAVSLRSRARRPVRPEGVTAGTF